MRSYIVLVLCCALGDVLGRPEIGGGYSYPGPEENHAVVDPPIVKHIYVHVPPPDPEFHAPPPRVVAPAAPKKHYKIVFIKAPTYAPPPAPLIPEVEQHQEKTLIYVLHKNPADMPPIIIPTAKPTQPSKPEVYFIRYKTQKEIGSYTPVPDTGYLPATTAGGHGVSPTPDSGIFISSTPRYHRAAPSSVSILPRVRSSTAAPAEAKSER